MAASPLLRVEGLSVSYGALEALRGLSWHVGEGEILGIIGPNGAGKSTCFEAATNMVAHRGRVFLEGDDVTRLPPHELAHRGMRRTFQQNAFFGELGVLENMTGALLRSHATPLAQSLFLPWVEGRRRRAAEATAREVLVRFGVGEELHARRPSAMPYGTQRLLSIALAHGVGPRVILLDEPAAGLGGTDMERLKTLLVQLRSEGLGLVIIEHHMDLIMSVADRIVVIDQGVMLATGTPAEVQDDPRVLEAYLGRAA